MIKKILFLLFFIGAGVLSETQNVGTSPEYIKSITSQWKGERFPDGWPKVSDDLLERLKRLPVEAVWAVLRNRETGNYGSQVPNSCLRVACFI